MSLERAIPDITLQCFEDVEGGIAEVTHIRK